MNLGARIGCWSGGGWTNPYDLGDGSLIAHWDAMWNAGGGKHSATLDVPVNLVESSILGELTRMGSGAITVNDDNLSFDGNVYLYGEKFTYDNGFTIISRFDTDTFNYGASVGWSYAGGAVRPTISLPSSGKVDVMCKTDKLVDITNGTYTFVVTLNQSYYGGYSVYGYADGIALFGRQTSGSEPFSGTTANHFRIFAYGNASDGNYMIGSGRFMYFAVYDRILSADEIKHLYDAVDKVRFGLT